MSPRLWYCNGDFDLQLRGAVSPRQRRLLPEMTSWFLAAASETDRILLDGEPDEEFLAYLRDAGLPPPQVCGAGTSCRGYTALPWGWSAQAVARLGAAGATLEHPPLDVVRQGNARSFSFALAQQRGLLLPGARLCRDIAQLSRELIQKPFMPRVIKPEHGNAGIGFRILRTPEQCRKALACCGELLRYGPLVIEPWLPRSMDISVRFELSPVGAVEGIRIARAMVTQSGAACGILHIPDDPAVVPFHRTLLDTVAFTGSALHARGYWGAVNIDAMVAETNGRQQLFPLLEINARQSMSGIGYAVQSRRAPGWPFLLRSCGARQRRFPPSVSDWRKLLTDLRLDAKHAQSVLLLTPPSYRNGAERHVAHRNVLYMTAPSAGALAQLDRTLTRLLTA